MFDDSLFELIFNGKVVFTEKSLAEAIALISIQKKELSAQKSNAAGNCCYSFCPSQITVYPIQIGSVDCYCIYYIPHVHTTTLYSGNPEYLPSFLQLVLYYYSGLNYLNIRQINAVNQVHRHILNENSKQFTNNYVKKLNDAALCDFGVEIGNILDYSEVLNGKKRSGIVLHV